MSTKRNDLTIKEKKDILVRFDKLDKCSQREAALALKIPQSTLNKILKNCKEIVEHEELSINLALQLGVDNFNPTIGWLTRWKNRNNIVFKKTCGEKKDADFQAAEDYLKNFIASSNYAPDDVYNADETGYEDDDNEETNEDITQKDTRIILEKLKGAVQKYGDNDTFQLFQKLQANMNTKLVDCQ